MTDAPPADGARIWPAMPAAFEAIIALCGYALIAESGTSALVRRPAAIVAAASAVMKDPTASYTLPCASTGDHRRSSKRRNEF